MHNKRNLTSMLALIALVACLSAAVPAQAASVSLEGMVTSSGEPGCVVVKDHEGNAFVLEGSGWYGLIGNDYVRLSGTMVPENRCGVAHGIQVSAVNTVWSDETHKVVVYEHTSGSFADWVRAHREREWAQWEKDHNIPPPPPSK